MTQQTSAHWLHGFPSPLGTLWLSATDQGLSGLRFGEQKHLPDFSDKRLWQRGQHRFMHAAMEQLTRYFDGQMRREDFRFDADLKLDLNQGGVFARAVWQALLRIRMGQSSSYSALAQEIGRPTATRAVGAAVGRNPIGILVPCHRVLGKSGALTGYAGGLERKVALLRLEGLID